MHTVLIVQYHISSNNNKQNTLLVQPPRHNRFAVWQAFLTTSKMFGFDETNSTVQYTIDKQVAVSTAFALNDSSFDGSSHAVWSTSRIESNISTYLILALQYRRPPQYSTGCSSIVYLYRYYFTSLPLLILLSLLYIININVIVVTITTTILLLVLLLFKEKYEPA